MHRLAARVLILNDTLNLLRPTLFDVSEAWPRRLEGTHLVDHLSRNDLACTYDSAERLDDAIRLYEQALIHSERLSGIEHPDTRWIRRMLDSIHENGR